MRHIMTDKQKENHITVSHKLFYHLNDDENFLKKVTKADEMWVYGYSQNKKAVIAGERKFAQM